MAFMGCTLEDSFYLSLQSLSLGYANPAPFTQGSLFLRFMWNVRGFKRGATPFYQIHPEGVKRTARGRRAERGRHCKEKLYCIRKGQKHECFCPLIILKSILGRKGFFITVLPLV